ncbi:MAG: hypothetical protein HY362_02260 [Candidatus Aenigmarchaeota archaeon]|nr:hypothetical protein [Candidatus Aenigmarchaeota archaeon]
MKTEELKSFVQEIVEKANNLKNKYTNEKKAQVNYACIFCQSNKQYNNLISTLEKIGNISKETPTGPIFHIEPINTVAGKLELLKIRKPDKSRPELGDADFTVSNYSEFKSKYLSQKGFSLIVRKDIEIIELVDIKSDVRTYFSNLPLDKQLGIK